MDIRATLFSCLLLTIPFQVAGENTCSCSIEQMAKAFTSVAKSATPAVVFVSIESIVENYNEFGAPGFPQQPPGFGGSDFFSQFFGGPSQRPPQPQRSQGSGFFITNDGYVMTNAHVVQGADKIAITMADGRVLPATLIGSDGRTDIAIIKVEGSDFPFLNFGDSDQLEVGERVFAIGSPFQLESTFTSGSVSAKWRQGLGISEYEDYIQTDTPLNPGNSGGPLLNWKGDVVGINTAIITRSGGNQGINFSVSSNLATRIRDQLVHKGAVTRGYLGVTMQPVDKEIAASFNLEKPEGALVADVMKDSPAAKAGLLQGDIILEYNGQNLKSYESFRNAVALMDPGTILNLKIIRKGEILTVPVTLGARSDDNAAPGVVAQKLGLDVDALTPELAKQLGYSKGEEGVVITRIKPGSPAAVLGLRPGCLVTSVNHQKVANVTEYNEALNEAAKSKRILLLVRHPSGMTKFYALRLD